MSILHNRRKDLLFPLFQTSQNSCLFIVMTYNYFKNRQQAGQILAEKLSEFKGTDSVILALPRGGVAIGRVIADILDLPLDIIITRKIGHPDYPEYAIGAVAASGSVVMNKEEEKRLDRDWLDSQIETEKIEIERREKLYSKNRKKIELKGKTAILVDDGIATGYTMLAAINSVKLQEPAEIIVAVPVSTKDAAQIISNRVDKFICLNIPDYFMGAISGYYDEFEQLSDVDVLNLLKNE